MTLALIKINKIPRLFVISKSTSDDGQVYLSGLRLSQTSAKGWTKFNFRNFFSWTAVKQISPHVNTRYKQVQGTSSAAESPMTNGTLECNTFLRGAVLHFSLYKALNKCCSLICVNHNLWIIEQLLHSKFESMMAWDSGYPL